jgi:hypothetical protein
MSKILDFCYELFRILLFFYKVIVTIKLFFILNFVLIIKLYTQFNNSAII